MANILLDKLGYIKLCDFGQTIKLLPGQEVCDIVGSRITWAPEVIKGEKYRLMPDWWSVGIIIYQLMM
jgi:serine/threonine protein kinase